ncbi:hypothetical protein FBZ98_103254 [Rhizobium sp. ERR 922]|uniref:RNase H type-1 domain-containing protein n=1 Tax=Rhizobium dioscoreae TaxID=2653122 RepID=A0ABQ0Z8H9_9HYPH|nr:MULTISPECIES: hypothetical protein [Rhizobium]MCZ3379319.1 hypothetical protein [Rhizobium sp. AG207R]TWB19822.1 hypothetical protein FBZ99_101605 [Rhizobium sp. ERR1071]TWB54867.1 hypothetical protein FBZ98_103254 [Rhizobium sp. ERR 922]TWB97798.1 hypothetical protein FBZ97_103629 [Rhizobium sp. ERR 942]GES46292.1 hypothetical protein RsS62_55440 [Rhizobium dioscoreae]
MANAQHIQRRSAHSTISPAPARFIIGRDRRGSWIVQDRQGLVGGLFRNEAAALHFAAEECNHNPADICLAPEGAVLDLDSFVQAASNLH